MASKAAFNNPACVFTIIIFFFLAVSEASLTHLVGGKKDGWKPQKKHTLKRRGHVLNRWAEHSRFQLGDFIEFNLDPSTDSVLEVTEEDYEHCNTRSPLKKFLGGNVKAKLDRVGPFFYISGVHERCELGESLHVVVLTPRYNPTTPETVALPGRPVLTGQPCTASTACTIISSAGSPLAPTSTSMQAGLLLFLLALLAVRL